MRTMQKRWAGWEFSSRAPQRKNCVCTSRVSVVFGFGPQTLLRSLLFVSKVTPGQAWNPRIIAQSASPRGGLLCWLEGTDPGLQALGFGSDQRGIAESVSQQRDALCG